MEADVQWLFDYIERATCEGELLTVQNIILYDKSDDVDYTKDEGIMQRLRDAWSAQMKKVMSTVVE